MGERVVGPKTASPSDIVGVQISTLDNSKGTAYLYIQNPLTVNVVIEYAPCEIVRVKVRMQSADMRIIYMRSSTQPTSFGSSNCQGFTKGGPPNLT